MPITKSEVLLKELGAKEHWVDTGREGGLGCPVCMGQLAGQNGWEGECKHLLYHCMEGSEWARECWVGESDFQAARRREAVLGLTGFRFDEKKADPKADSFLLKNEWVPLGTVQVDLGGIGWHAVFAVPMSKFEMGKSPTETAKEMTKALSEFLTAEPSEDDEETEDENA